jgi:hypothetical protein
MEAENSHFSYKCSNYTIAALRRQSAVEICTEGHVIFPQIFSVSKNVQIKCIFIMGFYIIILQFWKGIKINIKGVSVVGFRF